MRFLIKALLLLIIFSTPIVSNIYYFGFEQSKVLVFLILTFLAGLFWIVYSTINDLKIKLSTINYLSLFFIFILFLTSLNGINFKVSLFGKDPYYQGLILYSFLFLFSLLVSNFPINFKVWSMIILLSSLIISLIAIKQYIYFQFLKIPQILYAGRVVSTFGQPSFFAGYLLFALPLIYFLKPKENKLKLLWLIEFLIILIGIVLSFSKTALIILVVLVFIWLMSFLKNKYLKSFLILFSIISIISASYFSLKFQSGAVWDEFGLPYSDEWLINNSPEKRTFIWPIALYMFNKNPIFGVGLENFYGAFPKFKDFEQRPKQFHKLKDLIIDRSHNYFLDLLVFSGILGFFAFIMLFLFMITKSTSALFSIWLLIYLLWTALQPQSIVHLIFFWWLVGYLTEYNEYEQD